MDLDVRLEGFEEPIGRLSSNDRGAVRFEYLEDYSSRPEALALSLSLPVDRRDFDDFATPSLSYTTLRDTVSPPAGGRLFAAAVAPVTNPAQ